MKQPHIVIIGGGAAGLVSALVASHTSARTTLIEQNKMGGDCLNTGCVPSKSFIKAAKVAHTIQHAAQFGIQAHHQVDFPTVMASVRKTINTIAPKDSAARFEALGVTCLNARATIMPNLSVQTEDHTLQPKRIIIATGSSPRIPNIAGLDTVNYLTSDTVWKLNSLPKRLCVVGGGAIGCELAQAFVRLGSQVSIVESRSRLLANEDSDVSALIEKQFQQEGIKLYLSRDIVRIERAGDKNNENTLYCEYQNNTESLPFDEILVAIGRQADTQGFGLEHTSVCFNPNHTLQTNAGLRTHHRRIYACGDAAGPYQFTHVAAQQAWYSTINALFGRFKQLKMDYSVIPQAVFTSPEVARVGINETIANATGQAYELTCFPLTELDRAIIDGNTKGFVKVLTQPNKDKLLGACIVGANAAELIAAYTNAMKNRLGLKTLLNTPQIYPSLSEANKFTAAKWQTAHMPDFALKLVRAWFSR